MVAELQKYAGSTVNLMSETREHTAELNSDVIRLTRFSVADEIKKLEALQKRIFEEMRSVLSISAKITLVEPKSIERGLGKAKRVEIRNVK